MAGSKETVKIFLADKLLAGFAVGVVNFGSIGCLRFDSKLVQRDSFPFDRYFRVSFGSIASRIPHASQIWTQSRATSDEGQEYYPQLQ